MLNFSDFTTAVDYILEYLRAKETRQLENNIRQILLELLEDPNYTKRSFEKLLEQTAVFDDDHTALRRQLIVLGARRYISAQEQEMWGLRTRNADEKPEPPESRASTASTFIVGVAASVVAAVIIGIATKLVWPVISEYTHPFDPDYAVQLATYRPENCLVALGEVTQYVRGRVFDSDPTIFQTETGLNVVLVPAETKEEAEHYRSVAIAAAVRFPDENLAEAFVIDLRSKDWKPVDC